MSDEEPVEALAAAPKRAAKKSAAKKKPSTRTIGTNRYGSELDPPKKHSERIKVDLYEVKKASNEGEEEHPDDETKGPTVTKTVTSRKVTISPSLLIGVRLDPRQAWEYFHLMEPSLVKDPGFPTGNKVESLRIRPWEYSWKGAEDMDMVYGTIMPNVATLMQYFCLSMDEHKMTMIADSYGYVYIGYMPQPYSSQDGYRGYIQYNYRDMHKLDVKQMENLQRLMYRIPLSDTGLTKDQEKQLHELRMGGMGKYPSYFQVPDMVAIMGGVHLER